MLSMDFFLGVQVDEFVGNARQFIFETYCRIHQTCVPCRAGRCLAACELEYHFRVAKPALATLAKWYRVGLVLTCSECELNGSVCRLLLF
eukprot:SAG31_NODE_39455_length_288_cov_0.761905_1_plen_89_part_10